MMDHNLLVYLHGFGFDHTNNQQEITYLTQLLGLSDYVSFDAPFDSERDRGGFAWVPIQKEPRKWLFDDEKFEQSLQYVEDKIQQELDIRNMNWGQVILCGRSQGAMMAMWLGLMGKHKVQAVISLCGLWHGDVVCHPVHDVPVVRLAGGQDEVLTQEQKSSYQLLQHKGVGVRYFVDKESTHDEISRRGIERVMEVLRIG